MNREELVKKVVTEKEENENLLNRNEKFVLDLIQEGDFSVQEVEKIAGRIEANAKQLELDLQKAGAVIPDGTQDGSPGNGNEGDIDTEYCHKHPDQIICLLAQSNLRLVSFYKKFISESLRNVEQADIKELEKHLENLQFNNNQLKLENQRLSR
ncbi:MAG: hypothetical protein QTN59_08255 [Candidatus Electrothrix communis]|nr:MAG: hypothetical protein QTN59_08255 [Candidatus Electrothrix communis]